MRTRFSNGSVGHEKAGAIASAKRALRLSPRGGEAASFVPVRLIAPEPAPLREAAEKGSTPTPHRNPPSASRLGAVEIRLPNGAQVRIEDGVDGEVLRLVLSTLNGQ
jgi:hypothetical protein